MLAKSCSRSHGQPPSGLRRRAMMSIRARMSPRSGLLIQGVPPIDDSRGFAPLARLPGPDCADPLAPRQGRITQGDEVAVEDRAALVVAERTAARVDQDSPGA